MAELTRFDPSGVGWKLTAQGVFVEGTGVERTSGAPRTVTSICERFHAEIDHASAETGVPVLLLIATVATETGGRADAVRFEPGYVDEGSTPHRVSSGLMQTLLSTASSMLQMSVGIEALKDPLLSLRAGALYIAHQSKKTGLDPVLVPAAYNAGGLYLQTSIKNRWKLRQYPIGTGAHVDRFIRFYNDAVAVLGTARSAKLPGQGPPQPLASVANGAEVRFSNPAKAAFVPGYAISVVQELLRRSGNPRALITSTLRDPVEQARVMYQNCEKKGADSQLALYGAPGRAVVRVYIQAKEQGLGATDTIARMRDEILRLGPYNVSHHAGDPTKLAVLDIAPSSLSNPQRFIDAARSEKRVTKVLVPPNDPAIHIEIPLTSRVD